MPLIELDSYNWPQNPHELAAKSTLIDLRLNGRSMVRQGWRSPVSSMVARPAPSLQHLNGGPAREAVPVPAVGLGPLGHVGLLCGRGRKTTLRPDLDGYPIDTLAILGAQRRKIYV